MSKVDYSGIKLASDKIGKNIKKIKEDYLEIESCLGKIKSYLNKLNSYDGARAGFVNEYNVNGEGTIRKVERWKIRCSSLEMPNFLKSYKNNLDLLSEKQEDLEESADDLKKMIKKIEKELGGEYVNHYLYKNIHEDKSKFVSYDLSDDEILQLARLCAQEQGSGNLKGILWEASFIANKYELSGGKGDDNVQYDSIVDYARNCGWWEDSANVMDGSKDNKNGNPVNGEIKELVKEVFVNKKRVLPKYVDEHDLLMDLSEVKTNDVTINKENADEYVPYKTICIQNSERIKNGDFWTYYGHSTKDSDPFGFTNANNINKYGEFCYDADDVIMSVKKNSKMLANK